MNLTAASFNQKLIELSRDLRKALRDHEGQVQVYAACERIYRLNRAKALLQSSGTSADKREAEVDSFPISGDPDIAEDERRNEPETIADLRYRRDLAEGMKLAKLELVRSIRGEISAYQSLMAAYRAEADFDRTGPEAA